ncbi:hypothetical protein Tco_0336683 [Tanacetum coccineum]
MVAYLQKSEGSEGFHQIIDFLSASHIRYALTKSPTIYVSLIVQFWQTASASTLENGDMEIIAIIDGKVKVVSEASIRRHPKLEDSDCISTLPTLKNFDQSEGSTILVESHHTPISAPSRVHEEVNTFNAKEWDNIQAQIEADEELAHKLQAQERERYSEADKARLLVELINERKRKFAQQRAEQRRNKPMTQAQQRTYMCNYIKHMGSHTLQQLKKLSFDEIKELFETTMKRVNTFTPMESDDTVPKVVAGSSKRDAEQELNQESSKRQKIGEGSEPAEESKDELSQEQLQQLMIIVPEEGMNVEALQTKYPIIDWEVYTEDSRMYWKIIRVGNHTEVYQIFEDMLKNFDRDDLVKLWSLVHERFNSTEPTEDKERELWVELKRLFEPDDDDILWKLQRLQKERDAQEEASRAAIYEETDNIQAMIEADEKLAARV